MAHFRLVGVFLVCWQARFFWASAGWYVLVEVVCVWGLLFERRWVLVPLVVPFQFWVPGFVAVEVGSRAWIGSWVLVRVTHKRERLAVLWFPGVGMLFRAGWPCWVTCPG